MFSIPCRAPPLQAAQLVVRARAPWVLLFERGPRPPIPPGPYSPLPWVPFLHTTKLVPGAGCTSFSLIQ